MQQKFWRVVLMLLLSILAGGVSAFADQAQSAQDTLDRMVREGWNPIAPGVVQVNREGNRVETFAIGPEGIRWALGQVMARLRFLEREYRAYPSSTDLPRTIASLREEVAKIRRDLRNMGANDEPPAGMDDKNGCSVSYSSNADAYHQTSVQGVAASASATFNNTCGYYAETYAFSYSRATRGTLTETLTQEDPKTGYTITSSAATSVQGSSNCYSEAYSFARYSPQNIFLSFSDTNYICPVPPPPALYASISGGGSTHVYGYGASSLTWYASASGGVPPYSYQWFRNGSLVGTGSSYTEWFYGSNYDWTETVNISLRVTDSIGQTKDSSSTSYVYYHYEYQNDNGGGCPDPRYYICP